MLCFRCEHRVSYFESKGKWQPRMECGMTESSKSCCYMYQPVKPVITVPASKDDKRPRYAGPMFSSREVGERVAEKEKDIVCDSIVNGDEIMAYWRPITDKDRKKIEKHERQQQKIREQMLEEINVKGDTK